jgi:hypothetical protein
LAGSSGFLARLERDWRKVVFRFVLALVGTSLAWVAVAPVCALGLAAVAKAAAPLFERTPGARYGVDGSRVLVQRPVRFAGETAARDVVFTVWVGAGAFGLPVFVALVLATPGWSRRARLQALGWGLGFLGLTQVMTVAVNVEFWQQMPVRGPAGQVAYLPGHSAWGLRAASALYYFLEIMGRGFFVLLTYAAAAGLHERRGLALAATSRNAPCPCGSGRKFKRCCGIAAPAGLPMEGR